MSLLSIRLAVHLLDEVKIRSKALHISNGKVILQCFFSLIGYLDAILFLNLGY